MTKLSLALFVSMAISSTTLWYRAGVAAAGDIAGNGGEFVICGQAQVFGQPAAGVYMMDHILATSRELKDLVEVHDIEESFDRIESLLKDSKPLTESFRAFRKSINNFESDPAMPYFWELSSLELKRLPTPENIRKVPENCRGVSDGGSESAGFSGPGVYQGIIRLAFGSLVKFSVNSSLYHKILDNPLQASFMYIHEWLWSHAIQLTSVYEINILLHRSKAEELAKEPETWLGHISKLGIVSDPKGAIQTPNSQNAGVHLVDDGKGNKGREHLFLPEAPPNRQLLNIVLRHLVVLREKERIGQKLRPLNKGQDCDKGTLGKILRSWSVTPQYYRKGYSILRYVVPDNCETPFFTLSYPVNEPPINAITEIGRGWVLPPPSVRSLPMSFRETVQMYFLYAEELTLKDRPDLRPLPPTAFACGLNFFGAGKDREGKPVVIGNEQPLDCLIRASDGLLQNGVTSEFHFIDLENLTEDLEESRPRS